MFFSKAVLNPHTLRVAEACRLGWWDLYKQHQIVWSFFPHQPDASRDFLFRREEQHGWPQLYLVSARPPIAPAGWQLQSKPYQPQLRPGERLAFSVRVNPVRTRSAPGQRHGQRHDVIMDAKQQLRAVDKVLPPQALLVQQEGAAWLAERAVRHGFTLQPEQIVVEGYRQQRTRRGARNITVTTLDLSGVLTVSDPEQLVATLHHGLGSAKGFGCGLLLVRRLG